MLNTDSDVVSTELTELTLHAPIGALVIVLYVGRRIEIVFFSFTMCKFCTIYFHMLEHL